MKRQLALLLGSTTLISTLSLALAADARAGHNHWGVAICSPLDSPDPPSPGAAGPGAVGTTAFCPHNQGSFHPYYSPVIPVANRWRYHYYTPYYPGYCAHSRHGSAAGGDGCCDTGPGPGTGLYVPGAPLTATYGPYTGAPQDEAILVHLGGLGLGPVVPVPPAPSVPAEVPEGRRD